MTITSTTISMVHVCIKEEFQITSVQLPCLQIGVQYKKCFKNTYLCSQNCSKNSAAFM